MIETVLALTLLVTSLITPIAPASTATSDSGPGPLPTCNPSTGACK